ncbi:peptidoglycan/LPS O-acetylase OafA/YrhL [Nocardioides albertanoniae]|uniref:Peptidoglycan/LPS O-acetylase OafA/YrhL n=1 Tax=Nocardioides albertanoniae TaxID=1175486 RepID=A0A543A548_9ACTN|nr:acyltransferase [Nocardioides albertanoniae]TQL67667.1 peptidoglycan/LPS O-acetylase OafA/YrhL [Nocardioides albertanoniae]
MAGSSHVPALDGLRGVAIGGVLLFHAGVLPGGFLGVDLFFVLSGFLITGLLLREAESGRVSLVGFWGRRLRRLFPAIAVTLVVVTVGVWGLQRLGVAGVGADLVRTTGSDALWSQLNLVNWHLLAQDASYWDAYGQARIFEHLWSIAVEEQFYVVWPLLVVVMLVFPGLDRTSAQVRVMVAALAGVVVSTVAMAALWGPAEDPTRVYTGTDTRAFSLLMGAAMATAPVRSGIRLLPGGGRLAGPLATGILASWALTDGVSSGWLFTGGLALHAAACALLIGLVEATGATWLEARPLRWLGEISYSLYLWHWPLIVLITALVGSDTIPVKLMAVVMAAAIACASTHLVEAPIRFRARWARGRMGVVAFGLVSAAMLLLWLCLPEPMAPKIDISDL